MSPFYDDPSLRDDFSPYEGLFDAQLRLAQAPRPLIETIVKRDGSEDRYDFHVITQAIREAAAGVGDDGDTADSLARAVTLFLSKQRSGRRVTVDDVHDAIVRVLMAMNARPVAAAYARMHERGAPRTQSGEHATHAQENADANTVAPIGCEELSDLFETGDTNPLASTLRFGQRLKRAFAEAHVYAQEVVTAHYTGDLHIHDIDAIDRLDTLGFSWPFEDDDADTPNPDLESFRELIPFAQNLRVALSPARVVDDTSVNDFVRAAIAIGASPEGLGARVVLCLSDENSEAALRWLDAYARHPQPEKSHLSLQVDLGPRSLESSDNTPFLHDVLARLSTLREIPLRLRRDQTLLLDDRVYGDGDEAIAGRVTLNLARVAMTCGRRALLVNELERLVELAVRAHCDKYVFLRTSRQRASIPHRARYHSASYILGLTGLNECVLRLTGSTLAESEEAMELGEEILARLRDHLAQWSTADGPRLLLGATTNAEISNRFDALDRERFGIELMQGLHVPASRWSTTPGVALAPPQPDPFEAARLESRFHPLLEHGKECRIAVDTTHSTEDLADLVRRVFLLTPCEALTIAMREDGP